MTISPDDDRVALPGGRPTLATRSWRAGRPGDGAGDEAGRAAGEVPFLLVHGLASNGRLWDGVGQRLAAAGHDAIAVDLRGHGLSEAPDDGYDTDTCADDLAVLVDALGLSGARAPVVVGQSWGGNVVLSLAARHPGLARGIACVDGGWIRPRDRFATFEECWAVLAPPAFGGITYDDLAARIAAAHPDWEPQALAGMLANLVQTPDGGVRARLAREHHRSIVRSLFEGDPHELYPLIDVPVLLVPATGEDAVPGDDERQATTRASVHLALALLPRGTVRWYQGADHDIHAQHPEGLTNDLRALLALLDPLRPFDPPRTTGKESAS